MSQPDTTTRLATPELSADDVRSRILWENEHLIIWDKPAGLPVHPGFGGGTTLDNYLPILRLNPSDRLPALLHRLDRETSGCLALGRSDEVIRTYNKFFEQQRVQKTYLTLVFGSLPASEGVISLPIRQFRIGAGMRSEIDELRGQAAETHYRTIKKHGALSLVEAMPKTGRMHQIRVHLAAMGCPIAGDRLYGGQDARFGQLMLHAAKLELPSSKLVPAITQESPLPTHWENYL